MGNIIKQLNQYATKYLNTRIVFILDMIMSLVASIVTLVWVDLFDVCNSFTFNTSILWIILSIVSSFIFIWLLKTYRIIIRHMSLREFTRFIPLAFLKVIFIGFVFAIYIEDADKLFIILVSEFCLTLGAFFILRIVMLMAYDILRGEKEVSRRSMNVLVYGVDINSVSLISRLKVSAHYRIVGFVQVGNSNVCHVISDIKAYYVSTEAQFKDLISEVGAEALLFATEHGASLEKDRMIKYAINCGIKLLFAPPINEMLDGKPLLHTIRNIDIEDLLMRPEIKISMDEIIANFNGKTVMVTGAAGSIGSELCRQLATFGVKELVLYDNSETPMHNLRLELEEEFPNLQFIPVVGDVRFLPRLDYAFSKWKPQIVFHAAAYKHVPLMEENPCEAVLVNVAGSRNVADKCIEYGVDKMVMVSTDKAVNPTNIMGCTKRLAEIYIQSLGLALERGQIVGRTQFVTTRFGNVLGSNGSVIPRFREQIAKGGPVTVTHPDITRYFMTIPEACRLVMEAAIMSTGNQIYVFDMGQSIKIDDLARRMIQLAGYIPNQDIKIEYTGLRPGEKLYEELLSYNESTFPTDHSRIRIAKVREYNYADALRVADELERLSRDVDISTMVRLMKQVVPEFISKNSHFEVYDHISKA